MRDGQGQFITFEGPEGSGKTTQSERLAERLTAEGIPVLRTREPGGTATGEYIREILQHGRSGETLFSETELLLFSASRAQLVHQVIRPALARGQWVLCDRFFDSTTAYQAYGHGLDVDKVEIIHGFAVGPTIPRRTFFLNLAVTESLRRMHLRNAERQTAPDRFEREEIAFHERVYAGYQALARRNPDRIRIIDATRTEAQVAERIWEELDDVRTGTG